MFKKTLSTALLVICYELLVMSCFAQEEKLTITTYYPSPYGSYYELRAYKLAVGNPNDTAYYGPRFVNAADNMGIGEILASTAFNISGRYYGTRIAEKVISADPRSGTDIMSDLSVNVLLDADNNNTDAAFRVLNNTSDSSDNSKELFRINDNGNVGIGTASPPVYNKLTVNGGWLQVTGAGATSWGDTATRIGVYDTDNTGGVTGWWFSQNNDGKFAIHQNAVMDRLIIDGSGNVGIGTATLPPTSRLSIGSNGYDGREYLKIDMENGAPPASDCNEQTEGGRMIYDDGNHALWVCDGAGGWKKVGGTLECQTVTSTSGGVDDKTATCSSGWTMTGGGCFFGGESAWCSGGSCRYNDSWRDDNCSYPEGNGWKCHDRTAHANVTAAYVRCCRMQ